LTGDGCPPLAQSTSASCTPKESPSPEPGTETEAAPLARSRRHRFASAAFSADPALRMSPIVTTAAPGSLFEVRGGFREPSQRPLLPFAELGPPMSVGGGDWKPEGARAPWAQDEP